MSSFYSAVLPGTASRNGTIQRDVLTKAGLGETATTSVQTQPRRKRQGHPKVEHLPALRVGPARHRKDLDQMCIRSNLVIANFCVKMLGSRRIGRSHALVPSTSRSHGERGDL